MREHNDMLEQEEARMELVQGHVLPTLLLVALGGALGASLRWGIDAVIGMTTDTSFPVSTLVINVAGAFALGMLVVAVVEAGALPTWTRAAFGIGLLGAFTTFSTYAVETFALAQSGAQLMAVLNIALMNFFGIMAAVAGVIVARALLLGS